MANTYDDATGVLLFDGPAVMTPVIRMLFTPFNLDETSYEGVDSQRYIAQLSEENEYDWDSYLEILIENARTTFGMVIPEACAPAEVIRMIGIHFGADLAAFSDKIDFEGGVSIGSLVKLALLLLDGHNLVGYALQGAWHCDRPRLWEFGGWAVYQSKRYAIDQSSADVLGFAREMDAALATDSLTAAGILYRWIEASLNGIADEPVRSDLARRVGQRLCMSGPARIVGEATDPATEAQWTRRVTVEAHACDEFGDGPAYARWEVTPTFIARLLSLQALCVEHRLTEVRVTDGPEVWGPGDVAEELRLNCPELVVTRLMFWFSDQPKHCSYAVETQCQWIESFLREVSGPGEPVYLGIDPAELEEEDESNKAQSPTGG
jgi:hypothetical protein